MPKSVQGESSRKTKRSFGILLPSRRPSYLKSVQGESSRKTKRSFGILLPSRRPSYLKSVQGESSRKTKRSFGILLPSRRPSYEKSVQGESSRKSKRSLGIFAAEPQLHKARAVMMTFLGIVTSWRGLSQCQFGLFFYHPKASALAIHFPCARSTCSMTSRAQP